MIDSETTFEYDARMQREDFKWGWVSHRPKPIGKPSTVTARDGLVFITSDDGKDCISMKPDDARRLGEALIRAADAKAKP